jgi:hypothetical protein
VCLCLCAERTDQNILQSKGNKSKKEVKGMDLHKHKTILSAISEKGKY